MSISIKNLNYVYDPDSPFSVAALENVDLNVFDNEFLAIIGHTGSGKSTFIQHLNGLIPVQSGSLTVGDYDLSSKNKKDKKIEVTLNQVIKTTYHPINKPEMVLKQETAEQEDIF